MSVDYALPFKMLSSLYGNINKNTETDVNRLSDKLSAYNPFGGSALNEAIASGVFETQRLADANKYGLMGTFLSSMYKMMDDARNQEALQYQKELNEFNQKMQLHNQGYTDKISDWNLRFMPLNFQKAMEEYNQFKDTYNRENKWDDWNWDNRFKKNGSGGSGYGSGGGSGGTTFYGAVPWASSYLDTHKKPETKDNSSWYYPPGQLGGNNTGGSGGGGVQGANTGNTVSNTGYNIAGASSGYGGIYGIPPGQYSGTAAGYGAGAGIPQNSYSYLYQPAGIPQF